MAASIPARAPVAPTTRWHVTVDSPLGLLTLVATAGSLTGLHVNAPRHGPAVAALGAPGDSTAAPFAAAALQLTAYFAGELTSFDLPLEPEGTPFQREVWAALRGVPYGQTTTYGQLADRLCRPGASRAVGLANARNPIFIMVPCHRLIGADGRLRGYGSGIARKQFLLDLERQRTAESPQ
ncbi:MAG: methylated-DNA--[protein]-cysteine S-methyltransferase [Actinomycetota bacterium]|nr:methylated-DNA--[protein]-cysteine S-methyltransferase [Actinomycetota bacterium]